MRPERAGIFFARICFALPLKGISPVKALIYRFAFLLVVLLLCVNCTSTEFQSWEGRNSVVVGHGGTRKVVDGMDVWTFGDPPRRFKVLGIIRDERPGGRLYVAQLKHDIVQKARENGGNAIIFVSSESQLAGYYTEGSASTYSNGGYGTTFGSATTVPITRRSSTYVVIRYLD
jgi:hypothetical protein